MRAARRKAEAGGGPAHELHQPPRREMTPGTAAYRM